jgi:carbon starvation protein CstA
MRTNAHRAWLLLPFVWQVGLAPLVNGVAARPFGLPFPMVWQMLGIVLASVCIAIVYRIDRRRGRRDGRA